MVDPPAGRPATDSRASDPDPEGIDPGQGEQRFSMLDAVGGYSVLVDSGLPTLVFVTVYSVGGRNLGVSLLAALAVAVVLAAVRLARRQPLPNVLAGLAGVGIAAFIAHRTGRAETIFLPGLLLNAGYAIAYVVSILIRWPVLGVALTFFRGETDMTWRTNPALVRAYSLASWIWVGMFGLRLAVQIPLYVAGEDALVALGVVKLAMGWPMLFLCIWLSYEIISRVPGWNGAARS
jgi:hypothetical protein